MIGFGLHNATEGFGIVAPLSGDAEKPSWRFLALLGVIGGGADLLRHRSSARRGRRPPCRCSSSRSPAGSILYVVMRAARRLPRSSRARPSRLGPAPRARRSASRTRLRARRRRRLAPSSTLASASAASAPVVPARHRARSRRAASSPTSCRTASARARSSRCRSGAMRARGVVVEVVDAPPDGRASLPVEQVVARAAGGARRPRALAGGLLRLDAGARAGAGRAGAPARRKEQAPPGERQSLEGEAAPERADDAAGAGGRAGRRRARRRRRPLPPLRRTGSGKTEVYLQAAPPRSSAGSARSCSCRRSRSRRRPSAAFAPASATRSRSCTRG